MLAIGSCLKQSAFYLCRWQDPSLEVMTAVEQFWWNFLIICISSWIVEEKMILGDGVCGTRWSTFYVHHPPLSVPWWHKPWKKSQLATNLMIKMCFILSYIAVFGTEIRNLIKVIKYREILQQKLFLTLKRWL